MDFGVSACEPVTESLRWGDQVTEIDAEEDGKGESGRADSDAEAIEVEVDWG